MRLHSNWKSIIKKAWSIRLMIIAGMLSAAEVVIPYFEASLPRGFFSLLSGAVVGSAFVARLVAQKDVD